MKVEYPQAFDAAMTGKFPGHAFATSWNLFLGFFGGYVTVLDGDHENLLTPEMAAYGSGWSDGYLAGQSAAQYSAPVRASKKR
jgi:hypothetical protein